MSNGPLPDSDHVTRYCSFTRLTEDGRVRPTAFLPEPDEPYLSVFWLEYTDLAGRRTQISDIRRRMSESGITLGGKARLAVVGVGRLRTSVRREFDRELSVRHEPRLDDGRYVDPSHSGIHGLTHDDLGIAAYIAEELIEVTYPARA